MPLLGFYLNAMIAPAGPPYLGRASPACTTASAQTPPAQQADQPQLRFHPVTRQTNPVGVIYASPAPGGCLPVLGATARPDNNAAQGGVYVPHGCPRAVAAAEGARR